MAEPRISYLDAATMDAGDIDFSPLEKLGKLTLHRHTSPDERLERAQAAEIVLINKVVLDRDILSACPDLRYVVVTATGTNNIDLDAAKEHNIPVSNVSGYSTESVAQHALGLMLNLTTNIHRYAAEAPQWSESPMFTRLDYPMHELAGKTLGIAGLGTIGKRVAALAQAFGMKVVALSRDESQSAEGPVERLPAHDFFASADFVSLHCPLTAENEGFINTETLGWMKSTAFLINTGRGPLVNETDLVEALKNGTIAGAGLDVLSVEPPPADHPLLASDIPNLIVTPHSAWATTESRTRLLEGVCGNIRAFLDGAEIPNRVA